MTTRKVQNPNAKGGAGFIWAIVAVIAIAAIVIGIIVFNGKKDRKDAIAEDMIDTTGITSTWEEGSDVIHLAAEGAEDAPEADLFEDFSCSHCAELEEATGDQALEALDADREFLKAGGVMTDDFIDGYIALKMQEVTKFRAATHPLEYQLYYGN